MCVRVEGKMGGGGGGGSNTIFKLTMRKPQPSTCDGVWCGDEILIFGGVHQSESSLCSCGFRATILLGGRGVERSGRLESWRSFRSGGYRGGTLTVRRVEVDGLCQVKSHMMTGYRLHSLLLKRRKLSSGGKGPTCGRFSFWTVGEPGR